MSKFKIANPKGRDSWFNEDAKLDCVVQRMKIVRPLNFGHWDFIGHWSLDIGISSPSYSDSTQWCFGSTGRTRELAMKAMTNKPAIASIVLL